MRKIVCVFNLFNLNQQILEVDEQNTVVIGNSSLSELGETIATLCEHKNINHVHLYGSSSYADKIIQDIIHTNTTRYNHRPIDIEVN